jgi:hypothetical protein
MISSQLSTHLKLEKEVGNNSFWMKISLLHYNRFQKLFLKKKTLLLLLLFDDKIIAHKLNEIGSFVILVMRNFGKLVLYKRFCCIIFRVIVFKQLILHNSLYNRFEPIPQKKKLSHFQA